MRPVSAHKMAFLRHRLMSSLSVKCTCSVHTLPLPRKHSAQQRAQNLATYRCQNLARYGGSSDRKRAFALALAEASEKQDVRLDVMNDSVRADCCLFPMDSPTLAMGIQLKTASKPERPNVWPFTAVTGYTGMPVVCWSIDQQSGWVFCGDWLDSNCKPTIRLRGADGELAKNALSGPSPLGIDAIVRFLPSITNRYKLSSKMQLSWDFRGAAHSLVKERIGIHLYHEHVDARAEFPRAQNVSYDLVRGAPTHARIQIRTARMRKGRTRFRIYLMEDSGAGSRRPYAASAFDELVAFSLDWDEKVAHMWAIPMSELIKRGFIRSDDGSCLGKFGITVYMAHQLRGTRGGKPDTWTANYYQGPVALELPDEASVVHHLLEEIRSGK